MDDDDDFGADPGFSAAMGVSAQPDTGGGLPAKPGGNKVQQPKPQALPGRTGPSSILVSTRQKGNPILSYVKALPWEYTDTPADYVLGITTCALFLSLKYHRLHPEYIYNRIRGLQGKYNLRILLTLVDIQNHEEPLKELSKTSLINNVTVILCWSSQEAGRYLELFKSYENAPPNSIRAQQSSSYADRLVDFITVPQRINKTDALGLVSTFGSVRTAVSARPEEVALVDGWGEKKVQRWCDTVREPFRIKRAAKRGAQRDGSPSPISKDPSMIEERPDSAIAARLGIAPAGPVDAQAQTPRTIDHEAVNTSPATHEIGKDPDEDEEAALLEAMGGDPTTTGKSQPKTKESVAGVGEEFTTALERFKKGA